MQWYDIILMIASLIIIVLSLLQGGKSEGASGAITGGGLNVFAKTKERGSEKVITWLTFGFAIVFVFLALIISVISPETASDASSSISSSL
ncbi:MAG: preprotein translocase subunit SecG [Firmicutes bacterium]|uniref:Protein-export membrane protein SecG n=1 Tax=Candidatus Alloenteromonas pullistercoris TaxID=2840785 RepID=A0A9D9GV99_9FIRM|nr:preprotein translocase subunit SecG [Candidatus Enteromonas pullistercoris]